MKFVKIKLSSEDKMPYWWEYDDSTPINNATLHNMGFGKNSGNDLTGYEIVESESWLTLDWNGTKVLDNSFNTGWLSKDGKFYGCDYEYHANQAILVHHSSEREMEENGFMKLTRTRKGEPLVLNVENVTIKQYEWIRKNYIAPDRDEVVEKLAWHLRVNLSGKNYKEEQTF